MANAKITDLTQATNAYNVASLGPADKAAPVTRLLALVALVLVGCPRPRFEPVSNCAPNTFRCHDNGPQTCSATRRWTSVGDPENPRCEGTCVVDDAGVALCLSVGAM